MITQLNKKSLTFLLGFVGAIGFEPVTLACKSDVEASFPSI